MIKDKLKAQAIRMNDQIVDSKLEHLGDALAENPAGHEQDWINHVDTAIRQLQGAWRGHQKDVKDPDGIFGEVDKGRPSLARQIDDIRTEDEEVPSELQGLRNDLQDISLISSAGVNELMAFRQRAQQIVSNLVDNKLAESKMLLESTNTDIGVGD